MKGYRKKSFPLDQIRRYLEPGPVVLVSCVWKGKQNIMTLGWHTVMEFTPALVGCIISSANHSFEMIRKSKECVINIPERQLAGTVADIGNCSGAEVDKFAEFHLTAEKGRFVSAPLIAECYANFECRISDSRCVEKYNFFIFEVLAAHVALSPKTPHTLHYRGKGQFLLSGRTVDYSRRFKAENL
jgi:flavin reductase (DIM6/NTAB) family NADH-FMN oxidoreductase RutF